MRLGGEGGWRQRVLCAASAVHRVGASLACSFLRYNGLAVIGAAGVAAGGAVVVGMRVTQALACIRLVAAAFNNTTAALRATPATRQPGGAADLRRRAFRACSWGARPLLAGLTCSLGVRFASSGA